MDTTQMFSIMDILILGAGCYLLYAWYLLQFRNTIKEGILIPSNSMKKCRDIEGYKSFMSGRLLAFALMAVVSGAIGLYNDYVQPIDSRIYLGLTGVFLLVLIWFVTQAKKAERDFFI